MICDLADLALGMYENMFVSEIATILNRGGLAVIPTDTLFGIVARAEDRKAVRRLYHLRRAVGRKKPFVILIASATALRDFGIALTAAQKRFLAKVWPGKVTVVFRCPQSRFAYLHLGTRALAFRVPHPRALRKLLRAVGPLVAPSANREGEKPAETILEARRYFGERVDFYLSAGRRLHGTPSTIVSLYEKTPRILRKGAGWTSSLAFATLIAKGGSFYEGE